VVARARVSVYDPKGEYQIVCEHLEPEGLGALQLAFDQLKERLAKEGLFDERRKRTLPLLPRKIGIVTSLDGAAVRDVVRVLRRRYPNAHLVIRPTRVQGDGSAIEIARAVTVVGQLAGVDVVIVARGGGSIEDLWAFNEEVVARAIAGCPVPTISGVGHETDVTIADFVADVRASTPSAAAELVVARKDEFTGRIDRLSERLTSGISSQLRRTDTRLHQLVMRSGFAAFPGRLALRGRAISELTHALNGTARTFLTRRQRRTDALRRQLDTYDLRRRLATIRTRLVTAAGLLQASGERHRQRAGHRLATLTTGLDSLSPLAVLARGYSVCWNADRTAVIRDAAQLRAGDAVRITLPHGEARCNVVTTDLSVKPETGHQ
jgi:exodeoxyribonuclease VII large subunit